MLSRLRSQKVQEIATAYLFLVPAIVILGTFVIGPVLYAIYLSFFDYDILSPETARFIGLGNYFEAFRDPVFKKAFTNVVIYAAGVVPTQMVIALILALMVTTGVRGQNFFRVAYFIPTVTSSVVVSIMFLYIYSKTGLLNHILGWFGIPPVSWMENARTALLSIMMMNVWSTVGQYMVLFTAGLNDIPDSYYEAAMVDGATYWQRLRYITLPLLRPTTLFVSIMSVIGTLQLFDQPYLMTNGQGGPADATMTVVLYVYKNAFGGYFRMGYASALATILFVVILALTYIQKRWFGEEVQY
ncbi:carbohydrate ABC transporter permease [Symbiobacterium terraclitae]|uniref:carbohydrate ABC transporter permease n=1 Tax=Symbiobacterium terraclitae TaxID=557451 RepID=UPI0035B56386